MVAEHVFVPDLAREFGVKIPDILHAAQVLGLPVRRGAARLTPSQARQLRQAYRDGAVKRRPPAPAPRPRFERLRTSRCRCCEHLFEQRESAAEFHCPRCADHYEIDGEDVTRTVDRLKSHVDLFRDRAEKAAEVATDRETRMKSALASRDTWRRMLVEIALGHEREGSGCCCGAPVFPCGTRRQLEMSNRGVNRQIEKFEEMHPDELLEALYGDRDSSSHWAWLES